MFRLPPNRIAIAVRSPEQDKANADEHSPEKLEYLEKSKRLEWGIYGLIGDASPLDVYPGIKPYGNELFRTTFPRALELRAKLLAAVRQRGRRRRLVSDRVARTATTQSPQWRSRTSSSTCS